MFPLCEGCLYFIEGQCINDTKTSVEDCYRAASKQHIGLSGLEVVRLVTNLMEKDYAFTVSIGRNLDEDGTWDLRVGPLGKCR